MASQAPPQLCFTKENLCFWQMLELVFSRLAGRDSVSEIPTTPSSICGDRSVLSLCFKPICVKSSVIVYLYQLNVAPQIFFPAHNEFPRNIFITNNHLDHAGELPLLFLFESERRHLAGEPRLRVLSGPEVQHKLKTCRLDEMLHLYTLVSHESPVICAQMQCFSI